MQILEEWEGNKIAMRGNDRNEELGENWDFPERKSA